MTNKKLKRSRAYESPESPVTPTPSPGRVARLRKRTRREGSPESPTPQTAMPLALIPSPPRPSRREQLATSIMPVVAFGPDWPGIKEIKTWVLFGDEHTDNDRAWHTNLEDLLGKEYQELTIYNYAARDETAEIGLQGQLDYFLRDCEADPEFRASTDPKSTFYVIWMGASDCEATDADDFPVIMTIVFGAIHGLSAKFGAQNFMLVDLPPMARCPAVPEEMRHTLSATLPTWNRLLRVHATQFIETIQLGSDAEAAESNAGRLERGALFLFSANTMVSGLLDDPEKYGLQKEDVDDEHGKIWDGVYLAERVHELLAEDMVRALTGEDVQLAEDEE